MTIKDDASFYGLTVAAASVGPASGLVLVPGKTKYGKYINGPRGILCRLLDTIQESLRYGGLLIVSSSGDKWQFYAGDTLRNVLALNKLGHSATDVPNPNDPDDSGEFRLTFGKKVANFYSAGGQYNFEHTATVIARPAPRTSPYWVETDQVLFYGIVTGASSGYGQSHHNNMVASDNTSYDPQYRCEFTREAASANKPIYSFMRTDVPMRVLFGEFTDRTKLAMLDAMPSEVRPYYERTFLAALAPFGNLRPTVAVHTVWRNGVLVTTVPFPQNFGLKRSLRVDNAAVNLEGLITRLPTPVAGDGHASTPWVAALRSAACRYNYNGEQWGSKAINFDTFSIDTYVSAFGQYANGTRLPLIAWGITRSDVVATPGLNGVMEGLAAGQLKDGHVLHRALVEGERYAAENSVNQDVMEVIRARLTVTRESELVSHRDGEIDPVADVGNASVLTALQGGNRLPESAFSAGTLPDVLSDFIDTWDRMAYDLARSEN